mmetsp:Transcript_118006/g.252032  ORF Transcript_118006/g.252032 Transcript_118006/m.252032 type:complete len:190 (+) Transcript_118006:107-676(+)
MPAGALGRLLAPSALPTSLNGERVKEGMGHLSEAVTLAKEQSQALESLHQKIEAIRAWAQKVGTFATELRSVEMDLANANALAAKVVGANTGVGELSTALKAVKAKAVHQQYSLGLAKDSVDKVVGNTAKASLDAGCLALAWALPSQGSSEQKPSAACCGRASSSRAGCNGRHGRRKDAVAAAAGARFL